MNTETMTQANPKLNNRAAKPETLRLWWLDGESSRIPAGVAFYDDKFGEYRLKIDVLFGDERQFYLRPMEATGDQVNYRVEVVKKRDGKFFRRNKIGEGFHDEKTGGDIFVKIPPFSSLLIVSGAHE